MKLVLSLLISTLSISVAAYLLPGAEVVSLQAAFVLAVVLGVLNTFVKPIISLLTFPITLVTLGLFALVINTGIVLLAEYFVPGFSLGDLLTAFLFSVVLSVLNAFLGKLA